MMVLILVLLGVTGGYGQRRLMLVHKIKPEKKKMIDQDWEYKIRTADTAFALKIIAFSDSSLSVPRAVKSGETTYTSQETKVHYAKRGLRLWKKRVAIDTTYNTYTETRSIYRTDTLAVSFQDIRVMKKSWFKKTDWVGVVLDNALTVMTSPSSHMDTKTMWQVQAVMLAVSVPVIFIGTRSTRYNLVKKWQLRAEG